jgi:antitoxin ParD1/3/4
MTLHVSLPKELEVLVHQQVQSGIYGSASEVVCEALQDFFEHLSQPPLRDICALNTEMQARRENYLAGKVEAMDGEQFFAGITEKYNLHE